MVNLRLQTGIVTGNAVAKLESVLQKLEKSLVGGMMNILFLFPPRALLSIQA